MKHFIASEEGDLLPQQLKAAKSTFKFQGLLYLATCNRVLYLIYDESPRFESKIQPFLESINPSLTEVSNQSQFQYFSGIDAINHLFEVSASIDSLVVGEREILRQLRVAYGQCRDWGLTNDYIRLLYKRAVVSAKSIYSQTRIGEKPVSIVSLAMRHLKDLELESDAKILLVGAGQTNVLVAKFLKKFGFTNVSVFNRTVEKAEELALFLGGESGKLSDLDNYAAGFDCAIVCTGKKEAWVTKDLINKWKPNPSAAIVDLAIPNNVHPSVAPHLNYIQIEDLRVLAERNMVFRQAEVNKAKELIADQIQEFYELLRVRIIANTLGKVPQGVKEVKNRALNEVFKKKIDQLPPDAQALISDMMDYMEKKCAGLPILAAKDTVKF